MSYILPGNYIVVNEMSYNRAKIGFNIGKCNKSACLTNHSSACLPQAGMAYSHCLHKSLDGTFSYEHPLASKMLTIEHRAFHLYREYCWSIDAYGGYQPASFIYLYLPML